MRAQTERAVRDADVALFMFDARAGLTPLDEEIARWLRTTKTPIILMGNKAEGRAADGGLMESYALGMGEPIAFSAEHAVGVAELFDAMRQLIEDWDEGG